ncbi:MAG: DUF2628 domain-containing protein [Bradyrhizobium sp.]|uniref:DUF2628 domain-containing protein n=1 Tax=Bradyrhizobium sp. TaxID=376 RepID=UPI002397C856|nr:DUF2628 domain-containing protein [Bradyrhizobium sp.]MDE2329428.1 DUF2628 domain-containing protein [Bradyrhizobium sp.]MDE2602421.1 DUF2628 domain-containing protein [Bradyrhizobium sp.]
MPVYTVHAPALTDASIVATDRFAFVRDGFHFWAMVFGPLWLLSHRLWLALIGWIAALAAVDFGLKALGASGLVVLLANFLIALLMGFEAASLRRWALSRGDWRQLDIVVGDDEESAERRFFDRWTVRQRGLANDQWATERGGPPPTRDIPGHAFSKPLPFTKTEIIGSFPHPGASG